MTKKELLDQLAEFPDNVQVLVWHEDIGLTKTDFVAENVGENEDNGAAVVYLKLDFIKSQI